ncbi:MAG: DUF1634 domain-containing protein [Acidobacteriia bacterium]|nr:DUF1634 domain-containing protein [Terriglobia bacterium]
MAVQNETGAATSTWTDQRLELIIGNLLRIGVAVAALVVLAGGILYLFKYGGDHVNYGSFRGEPGALRSIAGIVHGVGAGNSRAIMQFGLLLLIATPIARVVFSAFGFWRERDYPYVFITLIVLVVLLYSMLKSG